LSTCCLYGTDSFEFLNFSNGTINDARAQPGYY
jgi:hypothetical protein